MTNAFDSKDTEHMSLALLQAWAKLKPSGLMNGESEAQAKAALTRAIVEAAERGVREEDELVAAALAQYKLSLDVVRERDLPNDVNADPANRRH